MKLTGKTQAQIDKESQDKLIDQAQDEAEQLIKDTIRKMAIDKLAQGE